MDLNNVDVNEVIKIINKNTYPDGMIDMDADELIKEIEALKKWKYQDAAF